MNNTVDSIVSIIGKERTTAIRFDREIKTEQELINDPVYEAIFEGFTNEDKSYRIKYPKMNFSAYGSGKKIYEFYTMDGLNFFKEITLGSCISNTPFRQVLKAEDGAVILNSHSWGKTSENRALLRKTSFIIIG